MAAMAASTASSPSFFGALSHAAVNQLAGVGNVRALFCAVLNALFQVMEGERRHAVFLSILEQNIL